VIDYRDPGWSEKHKEYIEKQKRKWYIGLESWLNQVI
jgi:hypothetical protein